MYDFRETVVLITGASRGIGAAAAIMFGRAGALVAVNFKHNRRAAEKVADEIRAAGGTAEIFQADVGSPEQTRSMINNVVDRFGRLDVLVNNAGIWEEAAIDEMTPEQLEKTLSCNLKGCFYTTMAAVPHMKKRKSGKIIFVSSTAGQRGEAYHSHYAASKGALISLTKSLATELAADGILVNCVAPGWVDTDMSHAALISENGPKYLSLIPLGRAASAEEIAWPILFLSSAGASFITGEVLNVNGGAVLIG